MEHNLLEVLEFKMSFEKRTLSENNLSNVMTSFYNTIILSDINSKLLLTEDPWQIEPKHFGGNAEVKCHMSDFCEFLEEMEIITKDEETYESQFLKPVQLVIKNLIELRESKKITADIDGWIFAKSKATRIKSKEKSIVSVVFPELQTVMSVSIHKDTMSKTVPEYHQFKRSQPIGLINRVHQTKTSIEIQKNKTVSLSEFNFLFTAFSDIKKLGNSIEMEKFCEIQSIQSQIKTHMGHPFVSFAKVVSSRGSRITLKTVWDKEDNQKFTLSNHYYNNAKGTDPKKLVGKYVRFFGVAWYDSGYIHDIDFEKSEIFLMQEEENINRLRFEEILGHIRLRSNVSVKELEKLFNQKITADESIEIKDDLVKFRYRISNNPTCAGFIQTINEIRGLREKYKIAAVTVSQNQIIDSNKRSLYNWIQRIKSKKLKILYHILLHIQIQIDLKGSVELAAIVSKMQPMFTEEMVKRKYGFLKKLGFVEEDPKIKLTNAGTKILSAACKEELDNMTFKSQNIVKVENIENHGIPTSIFKQYIKNTSEFHPLKLDDDMETEVVWIKEGNSEPHEEIINDLLKKREKILEIMGSVSHEVTVEMLAQKFEEEGNHLGSFIISQLLTEMKEAGEIGNSGESWEYPINSRMYDLFKKYPNDSFDVEAICEKCMIVEDDYNVPRVKNYLKDFEKIGEIGKINGKWISNVNIKINKEKFKKKEIRAIALSILRKAGFQTPKIETVSDRYWKKPPSNDHLGNEFVSEISKIYFNKNHSNVTDEEIKHEIDLMNKDGTIITRD